MKEFSELVKRFDRIRTYVRDFYVYGFKTREDYSDGSGRTYDNERRRIESWFSPYIHSGYNGDRKKSVAITIDSRRIAVNPLFAAWKSKSFTSNDIMLHFFILDLLTDGSFYTADQAADELQERFGVLFDTQTVRKKLIEYESLGILISRKEGRKLLYGTGAAEFTDNGICSFSEFTDMVSFLQGSAPFGFIGSTILDNYQVENSSFRLKHDFLVHTLEDEILLGILTAMRERKFIRMENRSAKTGKIDVVEGTPLKILVSTQTGRRYAVIHQTRQKAPHTAARRNVAKRFSSFRLDYLLSAEPLDEDPDFEYHKNDLDKNLPKMWGVSFGDTHGMESISLTLILDEEKEAHIIGRLEREGRGGTVTRLEKGIYRYDRECFDCNELLPWVKTFTGRILSFFCSNFMIEKKFLRDMERMAAMYEDCSETPFSGEADRGADGTEGGM